MLGQNLNFVQVSWNLVLVSRNYFPTKKIIILISTWIRRHIFVEDAAGNNSFLTLYIAQPIDYIEYLFGVCWEMYEVKNKLFPSEINIFKVIPLWRLFENVGNKPSFHDLSWRISNICRKVQICIMNLLIVVD